MKKQIDAEKYIIKSNVNKAGLAFLVLFNVISSIIMVFTALISKYVIDCGVSKDGKKVFLYGLILIGLILSELLLNFFNNYYKEKIRIKLVYLSEEKVYSEILKKEYSFLTEMSRGQLITRSTSDIETIVRNYLNIIINLTSIITRLLGAVAMLMSFDWKFTTIFLVAAFSVAGSSFLFKKKLKTLNKASKAANEKVNNFYFEALNNILITKVFNIETKMVNTYKNLHDESRKAELNQKKFVFLTNSVFGFMFRISGAVTLIWATVALMRETITYGSLMAMVQLVGQIQAPILLLSGFIPQYYEMRVSAERIQAIFDMKDEECGNTVECGDLFGKFRAVSFENVSFSYKDKKVIDNLSFDIKRGDSVAVVGRSGCGKTTILKLLLSVYPCGEGKISFDFEDYKTENNINFRKMFSYVPQGNFLLSGSIRDNVCLLKENAAKEEINRALKAACVSDFTDNLKDGIGTVIGENGLGLSEGQSQRIAIVRALMNESPIILLDEATSALDEETELNVIKNISEMKDKTLIIVTHRKAALTICNKVLNVAEEES